MFPKRDRTMCNGTSVPLAPLKMEYFDSEDCVRSSNSSQGYNATEM